MFFHDQGHMPHQRDEHRPVVSAINLAQANGTTWLIFGDAEGGRRQRSALSCDILVEALALALRGTRPGATSRRTWPRVRKGGLAMLHQKPAPQ